MKAVIAGGTGWLGSALARDLCAAGHEVVVLSRTDGPFWLEGVRIVHWDGRTKDNWVCEIEGADAVVNFSGTSLASGRWTEVRKRALIASRIEPTKALVDAIEGASHRPTVMVSTSAVGYYGDGGDKALGEDEPPGSDFLARLCVMWEAAASRASTLGVRVVTPRVGVVLGSSGGPLSQLALPFRLFLGGPLGSGAQWVSWVHISDVVGMCRFAIERNEVGGPMNVTSPNPVTNSDLATALGRVLRRPSWLRVPGSVLRVAVGQLAESLLIGQRALPVLAERLGYQFQVPDLLDALRASLRATG